MDERQALETLTREEKTASRFLAQLKEKQEGLVEKKETRLKELETQNEKKREVR